MIHIQENFENKLIEEQIVSMLQNVLDNDSEDEEIHKKFSSIESFLEEKENFVFNPDDSFWPETQKESAFTSKLLENDSNITSIPQLPFSIYKRKDKKCNTADACISYKTNYLKPIIPTKTNGEYLKKVHQNISGNFNSIKDTAINFSPFENLFNNNSENSTLT
jgi:hypothetical protein